MISRQNAYYCIAVSVALSAIAQLSLKFSMLIFSEQISQGLFVITSLYESSILIWLGAGIACYVASLLFWLLAITRLDLSFAYPILSLSYVLVYVAAANLPGMHEEISWRRSVGVMVICLGIVLIMQSRHKKRP